MPRPLRPRSLAGALLSSLALALSIVGVALGDLSIATPAAAVSEAVEPEATPEESMEELVAPIALYPDELLGIVLPAATYPLQIVQAARFLEQRESDDSLKPDEDWNPSVLGLLNYPEVLQIMNEDLDWTWALGAAVTEDQDAVMAAVQRFRERVDTAGNLSSNDKVNVRREAVEGGDPGQQVIIIESASPEVIYVPVYEPARVVVHHVTPYPWYWSDPYPYYYRPAAVFWTGMFVGSAIAFSLHWHHHHHPRYRYRGGRIDIHRNIDVDVNVNRNVVRRHRGTVWAPERGRGRKIGARPTGARPDGRDLRDLRDRRRRATRDGDRRERGGDRTTRERDGRRERGDVRDTGRRGGDETARDGRRRSDEATEGRRRRGETRSDRRTPEQAERGQRTREEMRERRVPPSGGDERTRGDRERSGGPDVEWQRRRQDAESPRSRSGERDGSRVERSRSERDRSWSRSHQGRSRDRSVGERTRSSRSWGPRGGVRRERSVGRERGGRDRGRRR